jgi:alkylglycerol monooxygenase
METIGLFLSFMLSVSLEYLLILLFVVFLFAEMIISKLNKLRLYSFKDSVRNILIGVVSFLADILFSLLTFPLLVFLFDHARVFKFSNEGVVMFLVLFILVDLCEYWFHRLSHEINVLWRAHMVHHQSSFFNLTVGLRTSFFVPLFNIFFYALFPVLGFDPHQVLIILLVQGVYQLIIHTELVGKLGFLEYILVTPSAHRVHHGSNEIYLDKNYGKFFIIWDRIFGTYQPETEKAIYGLTKPMKSEGVFTSITDPFVDLYKSFFKEKGENKMRVLFGKP